MATATGTVYLVHAIDTEGPLYESLDATFDRLYEIFGIRLEPTRSNLLAIQNGTLDFGDKTDLVREALSSHRTTTLGTWDQIEQMLDRVTSDKFRNVERDSFGRGWVYSWFCLDHVGFENNPRRRDMGYHNVYDFYDRYLKQLKSCPDEIQWHFHPVSTYKDAHRCATHYFRSNEIFEILTRKIIDRNFFPSSFRAGFQVERPDSHWFLEQYIPFDISNMSTESTFDLDNSIDFKNGRSGDWRGAPFDWSVYHPSHDDYRRRGDCRRLIGRALNLRNRIGNLTQNEMNLAFERAANGVDSLVGMCSHDWRDLGPEVDEAREFLRNSSYKYPDVDFKFCTATEAFRKFVVKSGERPLELNIDFNEGTREDVPNVTITAKSGRVFGPQPFVAIKTKGGRYLHDNLDFDTRAGKWHYAFHADTLPLEDVREFAVAANDFLGNTSIARRCFDP
ncbi:hypothetical protein N9M22_05600 [Litoricolaceae bacterium]|nr:hypothetical protein [Litorivicinaceae bacterium]